MENKKIDEKVSSQINRMKQMMNYGLKTETKQYSTVEYSRTAADGKTYGIIREGNKYHIKVADVKNPTKSDYNYIGGFVNHKSNMFESYANAQKHFDIKMRSLNEAYGKTGENIDSWNMNGRNQTLNEMTDKMRLEIMRQREIMNNANIISEGKKDSSICKDKASCIEKNNIKVSKPTTGDAKGNGGDFFTEKPDGEFSDTQKNNIKGKQKPVLENAEPINEFMDAPLSNVNVASNNSGDGAGQTNIMGGSLGEDEDFEETDIDITDDGEDVDVDIDTVEDDFDSEDDDFSAEADDELEEFSDEDEEEFEDDSLTAEHENDEISTLRGEMSNMRSLIDAIANKLGVNEFDKDEPLYDDDNEEVETEIEFDDDSDDYDNEEVETEIEFDDEEDDEDGETEVYESRMYRQIMSEGAKMDKIKKTVKNVGKKALSKVKDTLRDMIDDDGLDLDAPNPAQATDEDWAEFEQKKAAAKKRRDARRGKVDETVLHDWGKHPRYQKEPMTYPSPRMEKKLGYYDEGEGEETTNKPYGKEIGNGKFFDQTKDVEKITNSIAEAILRGLKKNV